MLCSVEDYMGVVPQQTSGHRSVLVGSVLVPSLSQSPVNNPACSLCCLALGTEPSAPHYLTRALPDLRKYLLGFVQRVMGEEGILTMPGNNTTTTVATTAAATATASSSNSSTTTASTTAGPNHHQSGPLKCPRCDSTNTKFCYYNNYSLAQPRHFCKACKRYWTRGGTLRNVPVGGGCRKNKRVKKTPTPSAAASDPPALPIPAQMDVRPTHLNPLFYDMSNFTFQRLDPTLQNGNISLPCTTYDLQPQLNAIGLGFPPNHHQNNEEYQSGFSTHLSHLQQSLFHDYPLFGSAPAASHLVSRLKQSKTVDSLLHYDDLQASANGNLGLMKEIKLEGEANAIGYYENPFAAMTATTAAASTGQADSSFLYWNATAWPDVTNCGSSVAPLF